MSIIPASEALGTLRNGDFIRRAEAQLDMIISTAEVLAVQGPGGVRIVALDFRSEGSLGFESLMIGDSFDGPNASSVILMLSNGGTIVRTACDPPVAMSRGSEGLLVSSPVYSLSLSCEMSDTIAQVLVDGT